MAAASTVATLEAPAYRRVPSAEWPSVAAAVLEVEDGTRIEVAEGHRETLDGPLILDSAVLLEGERSAGTAGGGPLPLLMGEDGIVVAAGPGKNRVILRRLRLRITGGAPALVIVGGGTIEECEIESKGAGMEVASHSGNAVRIVRTTVRDCEVGISLAGGAASAALDGCRVEGCGLGLALTGLELAEGWSDALVSCAGVVMVGNEGADLRIQGWSVQEKDTQRLRQAPPGEQVSVSGWPNEHCTVVAPTDHGPVVLHIKGGSVNTTLFEDEEESQPCESGSERTAVQELEAEEEWVNEVAKGQP